MRTALALVLIAFLSPLAAQPRDDAAARALFDKLDTNHDSFLSSAELAAPAAQDHSWIAVDRNRDRRISRDEFGIVRNFASTPARGAAGATANAPSGKPK